MLLIGAAVRNSAHRNALLYLCYHRYAGETDQYAINSSVYINFVKSAQLSPTFQYRFSSI